MLVVDGRGGRTEGRQTRAKVEGQRTGGGGGDGGSKSGGAAGARLILADRSREENCPGRGRAVGGATNTAAAISYILNGTGLDGTTLDSTARVLVTPGDTRPPGSRRSSAPGWGVRGHPLPALRRALCAVATLKDGAHG